MYYIKPIKLIYLIIFQIIKKFNYVYYVINNYTKLILFSCNNTIILIFVFTQIDFKILLTK